METQDTLVITAIVVIGVVGILLLTAHYWYWEIYKKRTEMIVEMPKTLEDFKKVRETILELMSLSEKLDKTNAKIEELKPYDKCSIHKSNKNENRD